MRTYRDVSDGEEGPYTVKPSGIIGTFVVLGRQEKGHKVVRFHGTYQESTAVRDVLNFLGGHTHVAATGAPRARARGGR